MSNSTNLNTSFPPPSIVSEDLRNAGIWWIIASIFSIILSPTVVVIWFNSFLSMLFRPDYVSSFTIETLLILLMPFVVIAPILQLVAYNYTMKLEYLDSLLKWGGAFGIIQSLLYLFGGALLPFYAFSLGLAILAFYIGSIFGIIAVILLAIGFFKVGDQSDNTIVKVGSILILIISFIGGVLLGYGLKQTSEDIAVFTVRKINWEKIKNEIIDKLANEEPVHIYYFARGHGVIPLILKIKINEWISKGEIKGFLHRNILFPMES